MTRRKNDQYFTPSSAITRRLLDRHGWTSGTALEPCAGDGAIADVLRQYGMTVRTGDIDPELAPDIVWNFAVDGFDHQERYDFVITNPPFNLANEVVRAALTLSPVVAMLLRITWIEPCASRRWIWTCKPPKFIHPLHPRPGFTGDGKTDSATTAWFVWAPGPRGTEVEPFLDWHQDDQLDMWRTG